MRKLFKRRARIVVYLESEDVDRMERKARGSGRTLVEWAREKLLRAIGDNSDLRGATEMGVVVRSADATKRLVLHEAPIESAMSSEPFSEEFLKKENLVRTEPPLDKGAVVEATAAAPSDRSTTRRTCVHGTKAGHPCWRCRGIAVIE